MFGIGMTELMVIFVIGLVVLGPKRLPELARSLGKSLAEFRRASNDMRREFMAVSDEVKIEPPPLESPPAAGSEAKSDSDAKPGLETHASSDAKPGLEAVAPSEAASPDEPRDG